MSNSSSSAGLSKPSNPAKNPAPNPDGAPPGSPGLSFGFARPPRDFDSARTRREFSVRHGSGLWNPADGIDESIEDEITRKIAELAEEREEPITDEEKVRIADKTRSLREGGWLESLKLEFAGKDAVPIEYFNRLAAEHENTISKVARINARAERKVAEKDAQIEDLRDASRNEPGDDSTSSENAALHDENNDLKGKLAECQKRGGKLENKLQGLEDELQKEKSKLQETANGNDALAKCNGRVDDLKRQLDATKAALNTSRQTASQHYEAVESLSQQIMDIRRREDGLKDEVLKLREENKDLFKAAAPTKDLKELDTLKKQIVSSELERANCKAKLRSLEKENKDLKKAAAALGQPSDPEGLRKRIAELEAQIANCKAKVQSLEKEIKYLKNAAKDLQKRVSELEAQRVKCGDKVKSLEKENQSLKDAAALQGEPGDPEGLRARIVDLLSEIRARDENIKALEALLDEARNASPPNQEPATELQARCAELRTQRDLYRDRWARRVVANDRATLVEFWEAVENTGREIKQLYQGIERLSTVLGLTNNVLDTPAILDMIVTQVTSSVTDEKQTVQLHVLSLRNANSVAQIRIESLLRDLDRAVLSRTEDEVRVQLRTVNELEVENRVTLRTQTYRDHRRAMLGHIFEAQAEFLALAERSGDRVAIEGLVDRFLLPISLPGIRLAQDPRQ
ncbi:hypothetical protein E0Z10_g7104 [Xylaria hypoxylon]|uniref:Uncharacterized protein n=1 Tax=Xylaria hypoxylon TaxID=37992 RepID=A0A4Z0YEP1_9PEZI|nr:hypothetical protein E0Z10_g7104 [Xylaria hypoxylon]